MVKFFENSFHLNIFEKVIRITFSSRGLCGTIMSCDPMNPIIPDAGRPHILTFPTTWFKGRPYNKPNMSHIVWFNSSHWFLLNQQLTFYHKPRIDNNKTHKKKSQLSFMPVKNKNPYQQTFFNSFSSSINFFSSCRAKISTKCWALYNHLFPFWS